MATEGDVELELETETSGPERPPEKPRKHDSGAADLERVTDYAEEKEIQSSNLETVRSAASVPGRAEQSGFRAASASPRNHLPCGARRREDPGPEDERWRREDPGREDGALEPAAARLN